MASTSNGPSASHAALGRPGKSDAPLGRPGKRSLVAALAASGLLAGVLLAQAPASASAPPSNGVKAASLSFNRTWTQVLPDTGSPIALSSPNVATLDSGGPAVLVGDRAGHIYAFHLSNGSPVAGWPASTGGVAVDSTPSVSGSGPGATVFVGVGNSANPSAGGYEALNANGTQRWFTTVAAAPGSSADRGVQASLAVGKLQGTAAVVAGSMGQYEDALNASTGGVLPGFPWFQADSNFTTPALADLYGNGQTEIIEGGDSTFGNAFGTQYQNGGHLRVLSATGNSGQPEPNGGLVCQYNTNQVVQSSPAVGQFLGGGAVGIAFGTGTYWSNASNTNQLLAVSSHCGLAWATTLDGATNDSPALVDALGNGTLQVAEGTNNGSGGGSVYLLNGANGSVIWKTPAAGAVIGSIVSANLGSGYQDLIVPTTGGVQILDGRTGAQLATLGQGQMAEQNSPLVTEDPNGTIGITIAGYNASNQGQIEHFELAGSNGAGVNAPGAWPMFHRDPQLTGDAGTPAPVTEVPCSPPAGTPHGYYEAASDGGIFTFGNLPFCGSTGNIVLNQPVVGMASTPGAGGYWLVAADGGVFSFGNAAFHGSTGGMHLNQPIVGMAADPATGGYWLVAADGGVFSFDAPFYGSTGGMHLNQPIVGIAATPNGKGYWLVARDGGVFSFGNAAYHGSTGGMHLNAPVVGMAADPATGGYWLVGADGGVFSFDAPFYGSTGGMHLNAPIVGMQAQASGSGYRFVASDGGVFDYGSALFYGSEGGQHLNAPVVGMAGS